MSTPKIKLITLPHSFNLEQHMVKYPPEQYGFRSSLRFNKEKAYYFLELISSIAARNPDIVTKDGYTPIYQKAIRDSIKDIKSYIDYLIKTGVIMCDNTYTVGKKSLGYKWTAQYSLSRFSAKIIECRYTDEISSNYARQFRAYPYLFHWYQQNRLMIDDAAEDYAFQLYQAKMNDPTELSWGLNNEGDRKDPASQYHAAILNIAKIKYHLYEAHIDISVRRLHSAFTGLGKEYRKFVTYSGEKLVCIDIKNSQPYIVNLILNRNFWAENSTLPLNINSLPLEIRIPLITPTESLAMIRDYLNTVEEKHFIEYKNLVSSGKFYENIVDKVNGLGKTITREEAKLLMFYTIYSSNRNPTDLTLRKMRGIFNKMFPEVAALFKIIKREFKIFKDIKEIDGKQHNKLACLLQYIESQIILHKCCKRIWEEGNHQVPVFTIHDSIATTVENQDYVRRVIEDELTKAMGIKPSLMIEAWHTSNLLGYPTVPAVIPSGNS